MTDCAMLWVDLCETIPFWFLNDDPTYSSSIVFILRNIIRFLPRMPYSRLRKDPLVLLYCLKFSVIRIIRRLSKKFYSILLYDLFSLNANFMNSCKLYHHRFFQYFNSFRFTEFPSALRNNASFTDNEPINFIWFFKSYLLDHECHLILQQTN